MFTQIMDALIFLLLYVTKIGKHVQEYQIQYFILFY